MSERYPIVAVTGSSGAGTTSVRRAFEDMFAKQNISASIVEGDSFHKYNREEMRKNYDTLRKICPHKWERDWNDRSHKTSKYCVWCGL